MQCWLINLQRREEIWKAVTETARDYIDIDNTGNVKLDNESICISGIK